MDKRATTSSAASAARVVDVLVPVALNQAYSYRVPRGMDLAPGDVVCVPLGPREVIAVVWAARVVDVLVPVALNQAYSYRVPRGMDLAPGDVVCVPLGPREVIAVVWA